MYLKPPKRVSQDVRCEGTFWTHWFITPTFIYVDLILLFLTGCTYNFAQLWGTAFICHLLRSGRSGNWSSRHIVCIYCTSVLVYHFVLTASLIKGIRRCWMTSCSHCVYRRYDAIDFKAIGLLFVSLITPIWLKKVVALLIWPVVGIQTV